MKSCCKLVKPFWKGVAKRWNGIFKNSEQQRKLEGQDYRVLDEELPFAAAFIAWSTECEKTAPMTRMHIRYSVIPSDITDDTGRKVWGKDALCSLESTAKKFEKIFVVAFEVHFVSGLYAVMYHYLYHIVDDI